MRKQGQSTIITSNDLFKTYPYLLDLNELIKRYPWTNTRITYNKVCTCYRKPSNCTKSCVYSLLTIHNEVVNIWTHILGLIIAFYCLFTTFSTPYDDEHVGKTIIISIYVISGMIMFSNSTIFHTFCCHSDMKSRTVQCMDWAGISIYICGSNLIVSYFEIYTSGYHNIWFIYTFFNLIFGILIYFITYTALQTVYAPMDSKKNKSKSKRETDNKIISNNSSSSTSIFATIRAIMNTYVFRTGIGMIYAIGPMIAWFLGYLLTGTLNDHLGPIIRMYLCFGTVICCLLDFPEGYFPRGTFDIVVSHYYSTMLLCLLTILLRVHPIKYFTSVSSLAFTFCGDFTIQFQFHEERLLI